MCWERNAAICSNRIRHSTHVLYIFSGHSNKACYAKQANVGYMNATVNTYSDSGTHEGEGNEKNNFPLQKPVFPLYQNIHQPRSGYSSPHGLN